MDDDRIRKELAAKRRPGSVLTRLGGAKRVAAMLTGNDVPGPIRDVLTQAFSPQNGQVAPFGLPRRRGLGAALAKLSDKQWHRVVATLLPQITSSATSALDALARRPYQEGPTRKPFRAPRSRETQADIRARWLLQATMLVGEYDADIRWIAEHAAHLAGWSGGIDLGWLLAGAMNLKNEAAEEIEQILIASASGEHPTGQMGRHVTTALLSCDRPSAWEFVEKLLLAAQRQEGVRQAILETVDEAHPQAFRRMLRLVLEEDLGRFSSVVRAADTWLGFLWDGSSGVALEPLLRRALLFLDDPAARRAALDESDAEIVYLALWSAAFEDVESAIPSAAALLASPAAEIRFVATHFLVQSTWSSAAPPLVTALGDSDLRVAARALDNFGTDVTTFVDGERLFRELEQLIARVPARAQQLDGLVWPWWKRKLERVTVASALVANASAMAADRVLRYVPDLAPHERAAFLRRAAGLMHQRAFMAVSGGRRSLTPAERAMAVELLGDSSSVVRAAAFDALRELPLRPDEVERLVDLLGRKPGDLRTAALVRLRALDDDALLAVSDRLLGDATDLRRLAGLEVLRDAVESKRAVDAARVRLARYATKENLSEEERTHTTAVLDARTDVATTDDALGLVHPESRRAWPEPRARRVDLDTPGARAAMEDLAALVLAHKTTEIRRSSGDVVLLVESAGFAFGPRKPEDVSADPSPVPLAEVWKAWLRDRAGALRDPDGLELVRARMSNATDGVWSGTSATALQGLGAMSAGTSFLHGLLEWCIVWDPPAGVVDLLLDGFERSLASLTDDDFHHIANDTHFSGAVLLSQFLAKESDFRLKVRDAAGWLATIRWWRQLFPRSIQPKQAERVYGLLRWVQERSRGKASLPIVMDDFLDVYAAGIVGEPELFDLLAGPWTAPPHGSLLRSVSTRKVPRTLAEHPDVLTSIDRVRRRIIEVECARGDRLTAASPLARQLRSTGGLETLKSALPALGKSHFARTFGWAITGPSRQESLSHFVVRSVPGPEDTHEEFARWAREAKISQSRLIELAVYAPQWAAHVNHLLLWPGLESGVWWIQAHTKDDRSWQLQEMKQLWAAEISERTPLAASDLTEGAVDVEWFAEAFGQLGAERWKALDSAAKYAASSAGHTRAQLFARAMAGLTSRQELFTRIDGSRHQDSVRAVGLLPLAAGDDGRRDLLERYERLEEFRREARTFGAQRRQSETRAVQIAMANLARTAGYRDPQRLQWAMEREATADLVRGPVVLTRADVTLELSLDADGSAALRTTKKGKPLKAVPAALKNDADVEELKDRLQALKRQRSRVRAALEEALCRGDDFTGRELGELLQHPVLAPSVSQLVFVGDGLAGYLTEGGHALRDHTGSLHALGSNESVRIAHPVDLLARGDLGAWQRECFRAERIQPFKQIFRELYPLTEAERGSQRTRRYAGHQVNPRQALALLSGRGWIVRPDEGVSRTFHDAGFTARLGFQETFYTPADVEGLTLEEVVFTPKSEWRLLSLNEIPARLFSETMRDVDLIVAVAHQGGVDPEATASTIEMRASLVRESCELLRLDNVRVDGHHAVITGKLGEYSVHLGSAGAMLLPGTSIPIVAVHSQHRGRLFLPFADDDPRSAEVLSKVFLLARDQEIRDPAILTWIREGKGRGHVVPGVDATG